MAQAWVLTGEDDRRDLTTFLSRARRGDEAALARLSSREDLLAVYVCPLHGHGGPTVLGLRVFRLARSDEHDVVVPIEALLDRLARPENGLELPVPPTQTTAPWAGVSPPRGGWEQVGTLTGADLDAIAQQGIAEVVEGSGGQAAAAAVGQLRARVWSRPIELAVPGGVIQVPSGLAFVASLLGFLTGDLTLHRAGPWWRLSSPAGYVLGRRPAFG